MVWGTCRSHVGGSSRVVGKAESEGIETGMEWRRMFTLLTDKIE